MQEISQEPISTNANLPEITCSCSTSEISVDQTIYPEPFQSFVYDEPREPLLVVETNFTCDDIFPWKNDRIRSKMPGNWSDASKELGLVLLKDVNDFCQKNLKVSNFQTLSAIEIFFRTFKYLVNSKMSSRPEVTAFFQEQALRYTVEHPPKSLDIFTADECYGLILIFEKILLKHLILIRAVTAENCVASLRIAEPGSASAKGKKKK